MGYTWFEATLFTTTFLAIITGGVLLHSALWSFSVGCVEYGSFELESGELTQVCLKEGLVRDTALAKELKARAVIPREPSEYGAWQAVKHAAVNQGEEAARVIARESSEDVMTFNDSIPSPIPLGVDFGVSVTVEVV